MCHNCTRCVLERYLDNLIGMGSKLSSASDSETLAESAAATAMSGSVGGLNRTHHSRHHHYHRHHMTAGAARSRARSFAGGGAASGSAGSGALDIDVGGLLDLDHRPRSRSLVSAGSVPVRVFSFGTIVRFSFSGFEVNSSLKTVWLLVDWVAKNVEFQEEKLFSLNAY